MDRHKISRKLKRILSQNILYNEYITNRLSSYKIAQKYNCSKNVILKYLKLYNIPWRNKSEAQIGKIISLKTKRKQSLAHKGKESPFKGVTNRYTAEALINITIANQKNARKGKDHHNWQNGISKCGYPHYFNNDLKEEIRKRDNFICQCCGLKEENHFRGNKNINLIIHHIDYNKENCKEYNLITVCSKCNIIANFNRDYWFAYYTYIIENYIKEK